MVCPACLAECADAARFCASCGAILVAQASTSERRKIVTVLFCDITGSTALGEAVDVESLRRVMLRYFHAMRSCLERHGGTVEKFIGDAVMAVFGVPLVREDDALRAVRAALDMRAAIAALNAELDVEIGAAIEIRIGINTGEVVASGDPSEGQGLVSGDAVNVAARLEQMAAPGEILIGLSTYRLVDHAVLAEPRPPLRVKGKRHALPNVRLTGLRPAPTHLVRYPGIPLLGRDRPLAVLRLLLETVTQDRVCHLATVFGDAGIGKSRLIHQFLENARDAGARVGAGRCAPYGAPPLAALAEALQGIAHSPTGAEGQAPEDPQASGVPATLGCLMLDEMQRTGYSGVDFDNTVRALRRLVETLAHEQPLVIALDNLQWAQPTLLDAVEQLSDTIRAVPVLLLTASRYELLDQRPAWGGGKLSATSSLLTPLDGGTCRELAEILCEVTPHVAGSVEATDLAERVAAIAGGNPLFVEQLLAMRADGSESLPTTVRVLLAARLDLLDPAERVLLEWAAVLGRGFRPDELADLTRLAEPPVRIESLHALVRRRFLEPFRSGPGPTPWYRFVSPMIQEVVYGGMSKRACAQRHEQVADWLLQTAPDRDDLVGFHLGRSVQLRRTLGPLGVAGQALGERAAHHLTLAGRVALAACDIVRARDLVVRALDVLPQDHDAARLDLQLCQAEVLAAAGDAGGAERVLTEVLHEAGHAGHRTMAAHARLQLAVLAVDRAGPDQLAQTARSTLLEFERARDEVGQARAWLRVAQASQARTRFGEAVTGYERAVQHALRTDAPLDQATIFGNLAMALWLGPVPAEPAIAQCRQILARHGGHPAVRVAVECPLAALLAVRRDVTPARTLLAAAERTMSELGHAYALATVPLFLGTAEIAAGCLAAAEEALRRSWEAFARIGDQGMLYAVAGELARAVLLAGRPGEARQLLDARPVRREDPGGARHADTQSLLARSLAADELTARDSAQPALRLAEMAVAASQRTDSPIVRSVVLLDQAHVLYRYGRHAKAAVAARAAHAGFAAKGHLVGMEWAEAALDQIGSSNRNTA